jgi:hypothetical protein
VPWLATRRSRASRAGRGCDLKFHRVFSVDEDKHPLTVLLGCFLRVQLPQSLSLKWPTLDQ